MSSLSLIDSVTIAFWSPGPAEMMVLAVVALLLYGGNLPEVARSWGKSFAEFRRGLSGIQNELNDVIYSEPEQIAYYDDTGRDDTGRDDTSRDDISPDDTCRDDTYRDDAYLKEGYQEPEAYQEEQGESNEEGKDEIGEIGEIDEGEKTVNDASADTIVVDQIDEDTGLDTEDKLAD